MINNQQSKIITTLLFLLLNITTSCTNFMQKSTKLRKKKNYHIKKTYCHKIPTQFALINDQEQSQKNFQHFLKKLADKKISVNSIEKSIMWSLIQMNIRPHIVSPTSSFMTLVFNKGKQFFFEFNINTEIKKINSYKSQNIILTPYTYGLEYILKYFKSKYSLLSLANFLDKFYNYPIIVDKILKDQLLSTYINQLKENKILKKFYFINEDILRVNENIPSINYRKLIKSYLKSPAYKNKSNFYLVNTKLYTLSNNGQIIQTNYKLPPLSKSYLITSQKEPDPVHTFGLYDGNNFSFLGISSQKISQFIPYKNFITIQGTPSKNSSLVSFINQSHRYKISLVSTKSRSPAQIFTQLILNKYFSTLNSITDFDKILRNYRQILLINPKRIYYEFDKASEEEIKNLSNGSIPTYYIKSLGEITSTLHFNESYSGPVIDDRQNSLILCK